MQQRSTAIRMAAERKSKQIEEVQLARDKMIREQQQKVISEFLTLKNKFIIFLSTITYNTIYKGIV